MDRRRICDCAKTLSETNFQHPDLANKVPRPKIATNWDDVFATDVAIRFRLDPDEQVHKRLKIL